MRKLLDRALGAGPPHGGPHHPPHHHPHHPVSGWIPHEAVESLAARLEPYVDDPEYWARVIYTDPGPGRLHSMLALATLESIERLTILLKPLAEKTEGSSAPGA